MLRIQENVSDCMVLFTTPQVTHEPEIQLVGDRLLDLLYDLNPGQRLTLDFRNVVSLRSGMIGKLVLLQKAAKAARVQLVMHNISPQLLKVFRLIRLDSRFQFHGQETDLRVAP